MSDDSRGGGKGRTLLEVPPRCDIVMNRLPPVAAVARRPDLVLLDEATSGLDPVTEQRVLANLLAGPHAVVLVSHRTTALAQADVVAQLVDGAWVVTR